MMINLIISDTSDHKLINLTNKLINLINGDKSDNK